MYRWWIIGTAGLALTWLAARQLSRIDTDREFLLHNGVQP